MIIIIPAVVNVVPVRVLQVDSVALLEEGALAARDPENSPGYIEWLSELKRL